MQILRFRKLQFMFGYVRVRISEIWVFETTRIFEKVSKTQLCYTTSGDEPLDKRCFILLRQAWHKIADPGGIEDLHSRKKERNPNQEPGIRCAREPTLPTTALPHAQGKSKRRLERYWCATTADLLLWRRGCGLQSRNLCVIEWIEIEIIESSI